MPRPLPTKTFDIVHFTGLTRFAYTRGLHIYMTHGFASPLLYIYYENYGYDLRSLFTLDLFWLVNSSALIYLLVLARRWEET